MPADGVTSVSVVRRAANIRVRQLVDELGEPGSLSCRFFCECGEPTCGALVELHPGKFDAVVSEGRDAVLAAGHTLERSQLPRTRPAFESQHAR